MPSPWLRLKAIGDLVRPGAGDLGARQLRWLQSCLERNARCEFARKYRFDRMRGIDDFRRAVPLSGYDDYAAWMDRAADGQPDVVFAGRAVAFERTSGSTGGGKLIPYSAASLADFRRALLPWLSGLVSAFGLKHGSAYWAISPVLRTPACTRGGIPVGLPDGAYLGDEALSLFAQLSAVPSWVGEMRDLEQWQLATLYGLAVRSDLAVISVWSPTFFLLLLDAIDRRGDELLALLRSGATVAGHELPADVPARDRVQRYLATHDTGVLWPGLRLVSAWADGLAREYFGDLERRLPHAAFQPKGLLATEGVVSVPGPDGRPVLAADSGLFEFIDAAGNMCLAPELAADQRYEVVMTTSGGLYRYRTGDVVICDGHAGDLPVLRFVGRAGLTSDLVGEKLSEEFVARCLPEVGGFRMLVPVTANARGYALIVDERQRLNGAQLAEETERRLARNPHYAYARRLGQLGAVTVLSVNQPLTAYLRRMTASGMPSGTVKITALRPEPDWLNTFTGS